MFSGGIEIEQWHELGRQPRKMVKHSQTIRRLLPIECVWPFCGVGASRVNLQIASTWENKVLDMNSVDSYVSLNYLVVYLEFQ